MTGGGGKRTTGGGGGGGRGGLITSALGGNAGGLSITGGKAAGILVGAALPTSSNASMPAGAACIRPPPVGIRSPNS